MKSFWEGFEKQANVASQAKKLKGVFKGVEQHPRVLDYAAMRQASRHRGPANVLDYRQLEGQYRSQLENARKTPLWKKKMAEKSQNSGIKTRASESFYRAEGVGSKT